MIVHEHPAMAVDALMPGCNYVNAHAIEAAASPGDVWAALPAVAEAGLRSAPASVLLGLAALARLEQPRRFPRRMPTEPGGWIAAGGATFTVVHSDPGRELVLAGRHRYAEYAAGFFLEPAGGEGTRVYQVTRARFRRTLAGRLYFLGVRVFHDALVEGALRRLVRAAERRGRAA